MYFLGRVFLEFTKACRCGLGTYLKPCPTSMKEILYENSQRIKPINDFRKKVLLHGLQYAFAAISKNRIFKACLSFSAIEAQYLFEQN